MITQIYTRSQGVILSAEANPCHVKTKPRLLLKDFLQLVAVGFVALVSGHALLFGCLAGESLAVKPGGGFTEVFKFHLVPVHRLVERDGAEVRSDRGIGEVFLEVAEREPKERIPIGILAATEILAPRAEEETSPSELGENGLCYGFFVCHFVFSFVVLSGIVQTPHSISHSVSLCQWGVFGKKLRWFDGLERSAFINQESRCFSVRSMSREEDKRWARSAECSRR